jgi:hypothetical protein
MKLSTAIHLVQRVITGLPVEVYDDETEEIMSVPDYELCTPRPSGDCAGSREIGSANMILAYNLLYQKVIATQWKDNRSRGDNRTLTQKLFHEAVEDLQTNKIIRKKPELIRTTFKLVENLNARREERVTKKDQ